MFPPHVVTGSAAPTTLTSSQQLVAALDSAGFKIYSSIEGRIMGVGGAVNTSVQVGVAQVASDVATGTGGAGKVAEGAGGGRTSSVLTGGVG